MFYDQEKNNLSFQNLLSLSSKTEFLSSADPEASDFLYIGGKIKVPLTPRYHITVMLERFKVPHNWLTIVSIDASLSNGCAMHIWSL